MGLRAMRPLTWVSGNVVYGRSMRDPWAIIVMGIESQECAAHADRLRQLDQLRELLVDLAADVQLLRVHRYWAPARYVTEQTRSPTPHHQARSAYLAEQARDLDGAAAVPEVVLCVALRSGGGRAGERVGDALSDPAGQLEDLRSVLREVGLGSWARSQRDVDADHDRAGEVLARVLTFVPDARPASLATVEWLVRRAWTRGLGEPEVDGLDEPRALIFERNGRSQLRPERVDVLGWTDYLRPGYRELTGEGELGPFVQVGLIASCMPGDAPEASRVLEVFSAPQDRLPFPIDVALCARHVSPARATKAVDNERARADEAAREEHQAARGASDAALARSDVARDAETYLAGGLPLFEITLSVIVAAPDELTVRERVRETVACFRAHGVTLRQPAAQQLQLFFEHLPAQRPWTTGFVRRVTADQIAATAPRAAHRLGSSRGYAWGIAGPAACGAVARWCPQDGSRMNTAAGVLMVGDSGAGKTTAAAKLTYEAFLDGAVIFDFTGKADDHHWHTTHDVAPHCDVVELDADQAQWRGLLDPWCNAPAELRRDSALDFLTSLLPRGAAASWQTELLLAVDVVNERESAPCNAMVLTALEQRGGPVAVQIAEHLRAQSRSGMSQLGFADHARDGGARSLGERQVTHVQLEHLPVPERGVDRSSYDELERQGSALAKLIAMLGLGILARHPDREKLFNFDEVKVLLDHQFGRKLIDQLQRLGRSKQAVPVLQTQYASDIGLDRDSVGALFGSVFCFRAPSEEEALRSLDLLGRPPTAQLVRDLQSAPSGRALVRDHRGQVEWLTVTLPASLAARVQTNPHARARA